MVLDDPLHSAYWWVGKNLNGISQHTINYGASKDLILVHTYNTAKTNDKSTFLMKNGLQWYK